MPKKVLISLPPAMLEQVDFIAQEEHRTRSDLIRESLRRYLDNFRITHGIERSHGKRVEILAEVEEESTEQLAFA
jgi:metal-responsive CopG/Arc/MetJ family transcriptional regulator